MIRALFFDIDGTLVSFNTHQIPQSAIEALSIVKSEGIKIFIATGRPRSIINNIHSIEHLIDGYVTSNGAHCYVDDKTIYKCPISPDNVRILLSDAVQRDYSCIVVGEKDITAYNYKDNIDRIFRHHLNVDTIDYNIPIDVLLTQNILQITPFITSEQESDLMPRLHDCISSRWHPEFADITHVDADKGKGIEAVCQYLHIDIEECVAFGDGGNDISMIRRAGIGIAMGNAGEKLKEVADHITSHIDEDGVRNALQHLGLV